VPTLPPRPHYVDNTKTKYILTWCEAYGSLKYGWEFGEEKFRSAGCPESRCFLTSDRKYLGSVSEFDAIIFHQRSIQLRNTPAKRRPEQRYVHWMFESPAHSNYDFTPASKLAGFFNWSMSYRLDSHFPKPYGMFKEESPPPTTDLDEHIRQFGERNLNLSRKTKTEGKGLAAWFVSNCHSKSGREGLVSELKKHISVDVYGKGSCSDPGLKCERSQDDQCLQMLNTSYKFYLSLENSLCADYVTEKFWKVLQYNVIPVVLNGANMSNIAPKNSYIDFKDFNNSIAETAKYMLKVSEDDELFASYFWWRDFYRPSPGQSLEASAWCSLCSALHNDSLGPSVIADLQAWWHQGASCHSV